MKTSSLRLSGVVPVIGALLLILSEIVEVLGGGFSGPSFALFIAALLVSAAGIWVLHAGQAVRGGRSSIVGAALFSAGAVLQAVADIVGFGAATEAELQARTGLLVPIGGVLFVLGAAAFGVAVVRAGVYPRWKGVLTIVAPPFLPIVTVLGLPFVGTSIANVVLGVALLAMGSYVLTGQTQSVERVG